MADIYNKIKDNLFEKSNIDIQQGTVIDSFVLAVSDIMDKAYEEIENNRTPHIYTSLKGDNLDGLAMLCGITRDANESDKNFLYRITRWNTSNKSSNKSAIESALMNMQYCSNVTYVPLAYGCGTAAAYIIPRLMDSEHQKLAIDETINKLKDVTSPSTYINYIIPKVLSVDLVVIYKATNSDVKVIKENINKEIVEYINGVAPGEYLQVGEINKIGVNKSNVEYFNIAHIIVDKKEVGDVSILQMVESKFLISEENITWMEVE